MTVSTSIGEVAEELRMGPGSAPEGGEIQGPRAGWKLALQSFVEIKLAVAGTALVGVLNAGNTAPPSGTRAVADSVGGRLVIVYNG